MSRRNILGALLLFSVLTSSAQLMNVRKWRQTERDSLDNALLLYEENSYLQALPIFSDILAHHPKEEFLKYSYAKCALCRSDKHEDAYRYLNEVYDNNKKAPDIQYDMALAAHYNYKFDQATQFVTQYNANRKTSAEGRGRATLLKRYISNAKHYYNMPTPAKVTNLGTAINSVGDEFAPAIAADGSLFFSYTGVKSHGGRQHVGSENDSNLVFLPDIYVASSKKNELQPAWPLDSVNTNLGESVVSMSNDGRVLFIYRDIGDGHGDVYQSFKVGNTYSRPKKLKGLVNSYSWDGHCSLSPDGKTLYFSSDRSGGFGGRDIYRASLSTDSAWVHIINLGDSVNTAEDDDTPFMHADGKTLYYSSCGRTSMGGYDVFRAVMGTDSAFKKSENMGYPINTPADERFFVVTPDASMAYYSIARKDGKGMSDIYRVEYLGGDKPVLCLLKGKVTFNGKPVKANVQVNYAAGGATYGTYWSGSDNGSYLVAMPPGADLVATYSYKRLTKQTFTVNLKALTAYSEKVHDVTFNDKPDTLKPAAVPLAVKSGALPVAVKSATVPAAIASAAVPAVVATAAVPGIIKDDFVPNNNMQSKSMRYVGRYGETQADALEYRVQIAAVKGTSNKYVPIDQKRLGRVEKVNLGDGFTRLTVGGPFKTLKKAYDHNKKVAHGGQPDAFIIIVYKGRRVQFEELEKIGIYK